MARKSFKIQENIKQKWEARNIHRKQEVSIQNGRVGISLEFHCKNFFLLKSVSTWCFSEIACTSLKSQMVGPLWPLFTSLCNQIGKWLKKPGRRAYSVSRASKDLSSESWCKTQWKTGFYILVWCWILLHCMPVAFFDLFDTDDHIDRVYKELKQVCFIYFLL